MLLKHAEVLRSLGVGHHAGFKRGTNAVTLQIADASSFPCPILYFVPKKCQRKMVKEEGDVPVLQEAVAEGEDLHE